LPDDLKLYTDVEIWASVECSNFDPSISGIVLEELFKPGFFNTPTDTANVEKHVAKAGPILDVYEKVLAERKFLTGDDLTLADIFHVPYGFLLLTGTGQKDLFLSRPHFKRWFDSVIERESWKKILAMAAN
jgi:glutathione S-transferase